MTPHFPHWTHGRLGAARRLGAEDRRVGRHGMGLS